MAHVQCGAGKPSSLGAIVRCVAGTPGGHSSFDEILHTPFEPTAVGGRLVVRDFEQASLLRRAQKRRFVVSLLRVCGSVQALAEKYRTTKIFTHRGLHDISSRHERLFG